MRIRLLNVVTLCAVSVTAVLAGCSSRALPDPNPKVTKANFDRIENGMTKAEVDTILGEPWKIETPDSPEETLTLKDVQVSAIYEWSVGPEAAESKVEIGFNEGKVVAKEQNGL